MSTTRYTAVVALATAALACMTACGDDAADDGGGGPTLDELPALFTERVCPELEACFDAHTRELIFGDAGCQGRLLAQLEDGDFANLQAAVEAGRVEYDASAVDDCLAGVEGAGCAFGSQRRFESAACQRAFTGSVELGGDCGVDAECLGAAFCKTDGECPGACTALLAAGEPCEDDDDCEDGLACPDSLGTCAALADVGDPCRGDGGGECRADMACVGADDETGASGTCRLASDLFSAARGESCNLDATELCRAGLSCIVSLPTTGDSAEFICAEPSGSGEACVFGVPSPCPIDEYCDVDLDAEVVEGVCTPLPKAGETCVTAAGVFGCAPGLLCDVDNRCHALNRLGQPCASDDGCASGLCDGGTCKRPDGCEP